MLVETSIEGIDIRDRKTSAKLAYSSEPTPHCMGSIDEGLGRSHTRRRGLKIASPVRSLILSCSPMSFIR